MLKTTSKLPSDPLRIPLLAQNSLLYESVVTPKPGLVDPAHPGAHSDMTIFTFIDSSTALLTGFTDYYQAGRAHQGSLGRLFTKIRPIGLEIEEQMNQATLGVNTHKGAIFSFGILLASLGYFHQTQPSKFNQPLSEADSQTVFEIGQDMVQDSLGKDFIGLEDKIQLTNGEKLYLEHGIRGIRGEALEGYPLVQELALPYLRKMKKQEHSLSLNQTLLTTLFLLISQSEDSNLINRGGLTGLAWAQKEAQKILQTNIISQEDYFPELMAVNQRFVEKHLSPGGSADLLALTIFMAKLENLI